MRPCPVATALTTLPACGQAEPERSFHLLHAPLCQPPPALVPPRIPEAQGRPRPAVRLLSQLHLKCEVWNDAEDSLNHYRALQEPTLRESCKKVVLNVRLPFCFSHQGMLRVSPPLWGLNVSRQEKTDFLISHRHT